MKVRLTEAGKKVADSIEIPEAIREQFESIFQQGRLALFMTYGMSLKKWDEAGILDRELKPYIEMAKELEIIYIVTYGAWTAEHQYQKQLPKNVIILCNNSILPDALYSLLAPWIHRDSLKNVDYFKTNQMNGSHTAVIAKKVFGKKLFIRQGYPWLLTLQEKKAPLWKRIIAGLTEKLAYNTADGIMVTTERDKLQIQNNYSVPEQKVHIIPNYIDTDLFKQDPSIRIANRLLYVGRLEPEKNLINLIRAVKGLEVELILIGEGSLRPQLETLVKDEGIRNVKFLGRVPNESLPQEYNKAEIFILPSLYEGMPKVLIEAMACGSKVIGSNVRGIKDVIVHGINGYLCDITHTSIKASILNALQDGEQVREKAKETITKYSLQTIVIKELNIYKQRVG